MNILQLLTPAQTQHCFCSDSNVAYPEKSCRYQLESKIKSKATNLTFMVCSFHLTKTHVNWIFYAVKLKPMDSKRYLELHISIYTLHWKSQGDGLAYWENTMNWTTLASRYITCWLFTFLLALEIIGNGSVTMPGLSRLLPFCSVGQGQNWSLGHKSNLLWVCGLEQYCVRQCHWQTSTSIMGLYGQ